MVTSPIQIRKFVIYGLYTINFVDGYTHIACEESTSVGAEMSGRIYKCRTLIGACKLVLSQADISHLPFKCLDSLRDYNYSMPHCNNE